MTSPTYKTLRLGFESDSARQKAGVCCTRIESRKGSAVGGARIDNRKGDFAQRARMARDRIFYILEVGSKWSKLPSLVTTG